MGTRSMISVKNEDGTYDGVYCHYDGYPKGVGNTLNEHYISSDIVKELISFGGMSCLKPKIEECEFYIKRGEELCNYKALTFVGLCEKSKDIGCEYLYIFADGKWSHVKF